MTTVNTDTRVEIIKKAIRDVPDFPKPGIIFKDITTLVSDHEAFKYCIDLLYEKYKDAEIDFIAGPESRGFIFAAPLAQRLGAGLTLIRKPGKLPAKSIEYSYELEYGTDTLCIHEDAFASYRQKQSPSENSHMQGLGNDENRSLREVNEDLRNERNEVDGDFRRGSANVLIVDDLLATGGSAFATVELIKKAGANIAGAAFIIELDFLNGKEKLSGTEVYSIVHY